RYAAFTLGCSGHAERKGELSRGRRPDERERLARADAAAGDAIERCAGADASFVILSLGDVAPDDRTHAVAVLDARDRVGQCGGCHSAPLWAVSCLGVRTIRTFVLQPRKERARCQYGKNIRVLLSSEAGDRRPMGLSGPIDVDLSEREIAAGC